MNKRGIIKIGTLLALLLVTFSLILLATTSSAIITKEKYLLGEKVKIDLTSFNNYKLKITTPSTSYIQKGANEEIIFKPEELGNYRLTLDNEDSQKTFLFEVVDEKTNAQLATQKQAEQLTTNSATQVSTSKKIITKNKIEITTQPTSNKTNAIIKINTTIPQTTANQQFIKLYKKGTNQEITFESFDTDGNGLIDYLEWTSSNQGNQAFEIILIEKAEHLDSNRTFVQDVYDKVKERDNVWTTIPKNNYLRATFQTPLGPTKDITIYAKSSAENATVEVYEKDSDTLLATFPKISTDDKYQIFLSNLQGQQETFDLKITGGEIEFDYVVDPFLAEFASIAQIYQTDITQDASTEISVQFDEETIIGSNFSHSVNTNLQFNQDGWYKVSYGCLIQQIPIGGGARTEMTGFLELDGVEVIPSRTYTYLRDSEDSRDRGSLSAVTLINVTDQSNLTLQLVDLFGAEQPDPEESCWIYAEQLRRPAALIRETTNYDHNINTTDHFTQDFGEVVYEDTGNFTTDLTNNWISVDQSGWYKIYYVAGSEQTSGNSDNDRITPASYLYKNNTAELEPSMTYSYHKRANQAAFSSEEGYTMAFLNAGENISLRRFALERQQATALTFTLDDTWLLIEQIENDNVLLLWDTTGGQTITSASTETESAPANITWDTQAQVGSNFSHLTGTANFTINEDGWFEISYAVSFDGTTGSNRKTSCAQVLRDGVVLEPSRLCEYERDNNVEDNSVAANFIVNNTAGSEYTLQHTVTPQTANGGHALIADSSWISVMPVKIVIPDTTPPEVTINFPENKTYGINNIPLNFNVSLNEPGGTVFYTLDSGINNITMSTTDNLNYNATNSSLADGGYTFQVYANDTAGNQNNSVQLTFSIDTAPPEITLNSPTPDGVNYSVSNVIFNITLNKNGSAALYTLDGGVTNISLSTTDNLNYNATNTSIADGQYIAQFFINDTLGNRNESVQHSFGIDTQNPSAIIVEPTSINYTTNQLALNFTTSDSNVGIDSCWYSLNAGTTNNTISSCQNTTFTSPQGTVTLQFYVNDTVGNLNNTENITFFVDSLLPLVSFESPTPLNSSGREDTFLFVNLSITETNFANITYVLHNDTGQINTTTYLSPITTINWTGLSNNFDNYTYNVTVIDTLKNTNTTETRHLQLTPGDVNPPDIFINTPTSNGFSFNISSVDFDVTLSETGDTALYSLDNGITNNSMSTTDNLNYNATNSSISDGDYTVTFYVNDTAGNLGINSRTFTIDTMRPLINYGIGTENSGVNKSQNFIYLNVSVTEINEVLINFTLYTASGNLVNATARTDGTRTVNWTTLNDGNYEYNVTITDSASNKNTTQTRQIRLDTTNPGANLLSPTNDSALALAAQNLTVNATDNLGLANATLSIYNISNNLINQTTLNNYQNQTEFGITFTFPYDGNFTWNFLIADSAGNTNLTQNNTIRIDTTNPQIDFTSPTPVNGTEAEQSFIFLNLSLTENNFANITYTLANATGLVNQTTYTSEILSINWTNLPSGNITYLFNVTSFDTFGNFNNTETRTIKLIDTTNPSLVLVSPENTIYTSNQSLPLDFNVSDANLASCWYNLNDGSNITLPACGSTTFDVADEQSHTLNLYVNDTLGLTNASSVTFSVNTSLIITNTWKVQRGNVFVDGSQPVSINEVDSSKSFILHTQRSSDSGPDSLFAMSSFPLNNQIRFENVATGAGATVQWEVITGPDLTVRRGIQNFATTDLLINATLNRNFNLSSSFLIITTNLASESGPENQQGRWTGRFINQTLIELRRGISGTTGNVSWQAVQWSGASVQNGSFSASAPSGTSSIPNPVNRNQTFLIFSSTSDSGNALDFNNIGGFLPDSTTVSFYRQDDDAGSMFAEWFVVESQLLDIRRGSFDINSATPVDQSFTTLINQSRSFNRPSWDSTGSGTTHANAILSAGITSTTNLQATKGTGSQTQNVSWQVIEIEERDAPLVNLNYPSDNLNFETLTVNQFNYSATDESQIVNCSLFGNWTATWHRNQTVQNPPQENENNFSAVTVETDGFYLWNVECQDIYGNRGTNATNFTFSAFLFPEKPSLTNITQTINDGTGNITLSWGAASHAQNYRIYINSSLSGNFSLLNQTQNLNFTDTSFPGNIRRFYRIEATNPTGQNQSSQLFGAHIYTLQHNQNTRNWLGFPTNASYLTTANNSLNEIRNITAFTSWNATNQNRVTCNTFSCPSFPACTDTNCNFNLQAGKGYEANLNSSAPGEINWSLIGIVYNPSTVLLEKNATSFGKNWITLYANSSLTNAQELLENISNSDAASNWDSEQQTSQGLIPSPFPFGPPYIGTNFNTIIEKGYEISVTQNTNWTQS